MILESVRIKNFRSIIDTGWQNLCPDNITALIGQNESGKTSILEALMAFETGKIKQDDIRNDGTFPQVFCKFKSDKDEIEEIFGDEMFPGGSVEFLKNNNYILELSRNWSSIDDIGGLELDANLTKFWEDSSDKIHKIEKLINGENTVDVNAEKSDSPIITLNEFKDEIFTNAPQFIIFEDKSLLPRTIDFEDIEKENKDANGYIGAMNLLKITEFDIKQIKGNFDSRILEDKMGSLSKNFTADFQKYWGQKIGNNDKITVEIDVKNHPDTVDEKKRGKPYFIFYIKDSNGSLYPDQRSAGVRWFLSFYIQIEAMSKERQNIILIDEPGNSLHAKAQTDVLKIFEKIKNNLQIIYTTHSPYLIEIDKVYRILAVQRDDQKNNDTKILSIQKLGSANNDTLLPLYTSMGVDLSHQRVIKKKGNILLEEISAFYYFKAFKNLIEFSDEIYFLPATGVSNIPMLANLMCGWGLDFCVIFDDDSQGRRIYNELMRTKIRDDKDLIKMKNFQGIEDIFTKIDFAKFVLNNSGKILKETNSEIAKKYSKPVLARDFMLKVENKEIKKEDLGAVTIANIEEIFNKIKASL